MATTSIWAVKGWLGKLVVYVENPDKTETPAYFEKQNADGHQIQGLSDVLDYAIQTNKTECIVHDETSETIRRFVSGINCSTAYARDEMLAVKKHFGKTDGVVAYHGYQSFAPGEATPELAHEIGVKLAEKLWGDRFQVIVATHLDKAHHLHNHFLLNNVSMIDGKKYYRSKRDYYTMKTESDKLCRAYKLSVIEDPISAKSKQYGEWKAEQDGNPTYRSLIKSDIDVAIAGAMTERQLWDNLYKKGYHVKFGKDITLRPEGKDRGLKLCRNFGEDYSIDSIRKRILAQSRPHRQVTPPSSPLKKMQIKRYRKKPSRMTGLRALYFYYLFRMGALPKKRKPSSKQVYFLFREDIRFLRNISAETRLLVANKIETAEQLVAYKGKLQTEMDSLCEARKHLRYKLRSIKEDGKLVATKTEISGLSERVGKLRKEVKLCDDIEKRSAEMRDKIHTRQKDEKSKGREKTKNEPIRRSF